jgi:hypothetical protein
LSPGKKSHLHRHSPSVTAPANDAAALEKAAIAHRKGLRIATGALTSVDENSLHLEANELPLTLQRKNYYLPKRSPPPQHIMQTEDYPKCYYIRGDVAEWSKAPDLGSGLSRRGFKPHRRQNFLILHFKKIEIKTRDIVVNIPKWLRGLT